MATAKEVSVGEFDSLSGLTLITLQRGRLMFNMGPPSIKRTAPKPPSEASAAATTSDSSTSPPSTAMPPPRRRPLRRHFRSGFFTGRSLYAEEALYLVQRGALVVYEMEELVAGGDDEELSPRSAIDTRQRLSLARLTALVAHHQLVPLPALNVYGFLKEHKLHPRRSAWPASVVGPIGFVFEVFKTVAVTEYSRDAEQPRKADPPEDDDGCSGKPRLHSVCPATSKKITKRKVKRLALIFRVALTSFGTAMPSLRDLRQLVDTLGTLPEGAALESESAAAVGTPVKLAVVDEDHTVLLFEAV